MSAIRRCKKSNNHSHKVVASKDASDIKKLKLGQNQPAKVVGSGRAILKKLSHFRC